MWITSRRHDVGVFYFAWERSIPFVALMVVPYLSIDLFFVAAPFLFFRTEELKVYVLRVATSIVVAGVCFLLFPLRYACARPHASGWLGLLFDGFRTLDAPYNLCPSLHAALLLLLAEAYARHLHGFPRAIVLTWFVLIAFSPVLTHQHHLIDILGGFVLAALCLLLIGQSFPSLRGRESHNEAAI